LDIIEDRHDTIGVGSIDWQDKVFHCVSQIGIRGQVIFSLFLFLETQMCKVRQGTVSRNMPRKEVLGSLINSRVLPYYLWFSNLV